MPLRGGADVRKSYQPRAFAVTILCLVEMQFSGHVGAFRTRKDGCLIFVRLGDFQLEYGTRISGLAGTTFRVNERAGPRPFPHPSNELPLRRNMATRLRDGKNRDRSRYDYDRQDEPPSSQISRSILRLITLRRG